ncbi:MAG TPA: helix-turn-helix domain-containing protein [Acidimicrobiales bacterium]|nr:helix-turn-helix domain-containing protein [Acidimicrobiales bacterium]
MPRPRASGRERRRDEQWVSALDVAMAQVGDRWTLQVIEVLLAGPRRFSELQEAIPAVAPNVLSSRLRRLEQHGLVVASPYSERPPRLEYTVTQAARELAGAVLLLTRWGARDAGPDEGGPRHRVCGTPLEARWWCPTCASLGDDGHEDVTWV